MRHPSRIDEDSRFNGPLRHYHRSGAQPPRTWEEWVDGAPRTSGAFFKWLKISVVVMAVLVLGGIVAGLIIELR